MLKLPEKSELHEAARQTRLRAANLTHEGVVVNASAPMLPQNS